MRGLLVKDFRLILKQKYFLVVLLFIAFCLNMNSDSGFAIGYMTFVSAFLVLNTISYDEYDNGYPFLFTLPVERKTYAIEKYVFGLLAGAIAWVIGVLISLVQSVMGKGLPMQELLKICPVFIGIVILLMAVMIPFPLIFGREKGLIVTFVAMGMLVLVAYLTEKLCESRGMDVDQLVDTLSALNLGLLELAFCAGALVLFLVSCGICVACVKKKEY